MKLPFLQNYWLDSLYYSSHLQEHSAWWNWNLLEAVYKVHHPQIVSNIALCSLFPDWKYFLYTKRRPLDRAASEIGTKDHLIPMIEGQKLPKH